MTARSVPRRLAAVLAPVAVALAVYFLWARPAQLRWGATADEVRRPMPGDELDRTPTFLATRAITINAPPEQIWPWLLQMGYGRAGFYGYDLIENLGSPRGLRSADRIVPELQHFNVGDPVPLSAAASLVFQAIVPDRYLVWTGPDGRGAFVWALYPLDAGHTRLVSRIRWSHHWTRPLPLAFDLFTEFTDHLAVRKVLEGVKGRVEGHIEPMARTNLEFAVSVVSLLAFLGALVTGVVRPASWRNRGAGWAAGAVWLITWYTPVPLWVAILLDLLVLRLLWDAFRAPAAPGRTPGAV